LGVARQNSISLETIDFFSIRSRPGGMINVPFLLLSTLLSAFQGRRELALENLALRQQLAILTRTRQRPQLRKTDRLFWVRLLQIWNGWRKVLMVVRPETVVSWHRRSFRMFWTQRSRRKAA
jgi:hypothetical protein